MRCELTDLDAFVEDQIGLDSGVSEVQTPIELRQTGAEHRHDKLPFGFVCGRRLEYRTAIHHNPTTTVRLRRPGRRHMPVRTHAVGILDELAILGAQTCLLQDSAQERRLGLDVLVDVVHLRNDRPFQRGVLIAQHGVVAKCVLMPR